MKVEMNIFEHGTRFNLPLMHIPFTVQALAIKDDMAGDIVSLRSLPASQRLRYLSQVLAELVDGGVDDACMRNIHPTVGKRLWYMWLSRPTNKIFA